METGMNVLFISGITLGYMVADGADWRWQIPVVVLAILAKHVIYHFARTGKEGG